MAPPRKDKEEEQKLSPHLAKIYKTRVTLARKGKEAFHRQDYANVIKYYNQYLDIVARAHFTEVERLTPRTLAGGSGTVAELFLISHIYWSLATIYDLSPKLESQFRYSLMQFVQFSLNQKFHVANAEMLRKHIARGQLIHKAEFEEAYKQLHIISKKCFVASFALSEDHPLTCDLREFRDAIKQYRWGAKFTAVYYKYSPRIVRTLEQHWFINISSKYLLKSLFLLGSPLIKILSLTKYLRL